MYKKNGSLKKNHQDHHYATPTEKHHVVKNGLENKLSIKKSRVIDMSGG